MQNLFRVKRLTVDDLSKWVGQYIEITGMLEIHQNNIGSYIPQIVLKEATKIKLITKYEAGKLLISVSHQTFSRAVKATTFSSKATQTVRYSTSATQTLKQANLQPLANSTTNRAYYSSIKGKKILYLLKQILYLLIYIVCIIFFALLGGNVGSIFGALLGIVIIYGIFVPLKIIFGKD